MNEYDVKRLGLILAIQAEIEGMKIANMIREIQNYSPAYHEDDFLVKAGRLEELAHAHNEQL